MGVWGHDLGTSAADLLAPKPETFQQLVANMFPSGSGQLAKAVAEPYLVVGPPPVAEVRSNCGIPQRRLADNGSNPRSSDDEVLNCPATGSGHHALAARSRPRSSRPLQA
jgi:hypothetical protein